MTRLRQKYKKLKQAFERRPINGARQASCHPIRVVYRHYLSEREVAAWRDDLDLENLIREHAAKEIAERIIKGKLLTVWKDDVFGGTKYCFEVMIVPPFETSLERWIEEDFRLAYMREGGQDYACKHQDGNRTAERKI